ncbi:MAG: hypothetical protein PHP23_16465, partial [Desulfobacterales bacterium]|nr:hypothetical protein [Desulfobacterales bacterium]
MSNSDDIVKDERIKKEERKLKRLYIDIQKEQKSLIDGLIQRAAYMRITLEDYEKDLDAGGYTELFTQSEK